MRQTFTIFNQWEQKMRGIWLGKDDELGCRYGKEHEIEGYDRPLEAFGVVDEVGIVYGFAYLYDIDGFEITDWHLDATEDIDAVLEQYRRYADLGDEIACLNLGRYYEVEKKQPDEAVRWYLKGARLGNDRCVKWLEKLGASAE